MDVGTAHFFQTLHTTAFFHSTSNLNTRSPSRNPSNLSHIRSGKTSGGNVSTKQDKFSCQGWPKVNDALEKCPTSLTEVSCSNGTAPHPISTRNLAQHQQNCQNQMKHPL